MRNLVLKISLSADGFVCGPNGELGWIFSTTDVAAAAWTVENIWQAGAHLMGSRTYQDMAAYWPTSDEVFAPPMNAIPKVVFTRKPKPDRPNPSLTSQALRDTNSSRGNPKPSKEAEPAVLRGWLEPEVMGGDLGADIAELKRRPGKDLIAHGGASFAQALVSLGLVDEFRLLIHPIAIGSGRPLFGTLSKPLALLLVTVHSFPKSTVAKVYRPAGRSL
jgi:dihydrofolate reductase